MREILCYGQCKQHASHSSEVFFTSKSFIALSMPASMEVARGNGNVHLKRQAT